MKKASAVLLAACLFSFSAATAADEFSAEKVFQSLCRNCHGQDGAKPSGGAAVLKGQSADELAKKLEGFAAGTYGGNLKHTMENIVKKYTPEQRGALADYAASL